MRWARPSTIAVLPTPGSPISTGLFLVRRVRTWMTRRISSSRPMTGSSLPSSARSVRSTPNFSSAWNLSSGVLVGDAVARRGPRRSACEQRVLGRAGARSARRPGRRSRPARAAGARSRCTRRLELAHLVLGRAQDAEQLGRGRGLVGVGRAWAARRGAASTSARSARRVDAELAQHAGHHVVVLLEQHGEQVLGRRLRVLARGGQRDRGLEGLLGLDGEAVGVQGARLLGRGTDLSRVD